MRAHRIVGFCIVSFVMILIACTSLQNRSGQTILTNVRPAYAELFAEGEQAYGAGDLENAELALRRSLELNPDYYPALELLGFTLLSMGEYDESLRYLSELLTSNAYSVSARLGKGRIHLLQGDFEDAIFEFNIALNVNPANAEVHFYRSLTLRQMGKNYLSWTSFIRTIVNDASYRTTVEELIPLTNPHISRLFNGSRAGARRRPRWVSLGGDSPGRGA